MLSLPNPANNDEPQGALSSMSLGANQRVLSWLSRMSQVGLSFENLEQPVDARAKTSIEPSHSAAQAGTRIDARADDWQMVSALCGYTPTDFASAGSALPLSCAEIEHFRRNHRGTDNQVSRDFLTSKTELPSPLAEMYGLYLHRARIDAEAALFIAQATGSTRVARVMADLLCVGGFANGLEYISHMGLTYSVPAAFDTSDLIDRANHEAALRLAMPASHPAHLLKLNPDEIGVLASDIAERNALSPAEFLEKANLLAEARQDVTRLPIDQHFTTAVIEQDLPSSKPWTQRLIAAYARILEGWVAGLPEAETVIQ